jgi:hypothetical protein
MPYAHLHHTINCLVGPGGKTFDDKARPELEASELAAAQKDAGEVAAMLRKLM